MTDLYVTCLVACNLISAGAQGKTDKKNCRNEKIYSIYISVRYGCHLVSMNFNDNKNHNVNEINA